MKDPNRSAEIVRCETESSFRVGRAGMLYRDLFADEKFAAFHIRIPDAGEVPDYVHYHKIRFQMIFCLAGWARVVYEDQGEPFEMRAGDCVLQPPEIRHRVLEASAGFEVLEIVSPAEHETFPDDEMKLPTETFAPEKLFGGQRFVRHIAENAIWFGTEIDGIEFRDTGISDATDKFADVCVLRADREMKMPIIHSGEFLFFFVLKGSSRVYGGADEVYQLEKGASFVVPARKKYFIEATSGLEILRVHIAAE